MDLPISLQDITYAENYLAQGDLATATPLLERLVELAEEYIDAECKTRSARRDGREWAQRCPTAGAPCREQTRCHDVRARRALPKWRRSSAYHSSAAFHPYRKTQSFAAILSTGIKSVAEGGDALATLGFYNGPRPSDRRAACTPAAR